MQDSAASLPSKSAVRGRLCRDQISHFMGISSRLQIHQGCKGETQVLVGAFGYCDSCSQSEKIFRIKDQDFKMSQELIIVEIQ